MNLRDLAVRFVPRHTRVGRFAWRLGRRVFAPKILVPGTLGDVLLLTPRSRLSAAALRDSGFAESIRVDSSWPVRARDVHRSHGYHLCVIEIGADPERYVNAYRAAFVESSFILLDVGDLTPLIWRLRGLGDALGYRATYDAREVQDGLDPAIPEEQRFARASIAQLARRAKFIAVRTRAEADQISDVGSRTPTAVIPAGRGAVAALATGIASTLAMVKDPAHGALELWATALADLGIRETGAGNLPGLSYLQAMESFKGTPQNIRNRA
ncbi:MAG: hypothetical protein QOE25_1461 [Actinomycetota bacterium]|nr:hypothetical protein [Actinomycetota bacterium]